MQLIDLSQRLADGALAYPGDESGIAIDRLEYDVPGMTVSRLSVFDPHCGTHFDAPLHFDPQGCDIADTPLRFPEITLICTSGSTLDAALLDGTDAVAGKAVLFSTGWEQRAGTREYYAGFPVLTEALADRLVAGRVALVGFDSPSVDCTTGDFLVHRKLLSAGIPILEGLANLSELKRSIDRGANVRLAAFPLRIRGLEGSPVRAVAIVE